MIREATSDAIGTHERASATPAVRGDDAGKPPTGGTAPGRHGSAPAWLPERLDLAAHQRWFAEVVTTPESEPAPVDERSAAALVRPDERLGALERLEIYRRGYHARLVECLADDYPALQHLLGEARFEELCRAYIARFPSTGPNLNAYGRHMPEHCGPGFAADLAALEWAIVEAIHAPTSSVITPDDLAKVPAERWPGARLVANPSLRILRLDHAVNAWFQAFRTGEATEPGAAAPIRVAVYRTGTTLWRMELPPAAVTLFEALAGGATLAAALDRVAPGLAGMDEAEAAQRVMGWFQSGVSSGLFSGVLAD